MVEWPLCVFLCVTCGVLGASAALFWAGLAAKASNRPLITDLHGGNGMLKDKKGAALVEYGLLIAGVALVVAAAVTIFGHKTNDLFSGIASVLPGAHADDNGPIQSGRLLETTSSSTGGVGAEGIKLNIEGIEQNTSTDRLANNLGIPVDLLILEPRSGNPGGFGQ